MGKRQVGELELSEFVSTLILSEIVSVPIENTDIPLTSALIPLLIIISLEISLSYACTKSELMKRILGGKPSILISKGIIVPQELENARISIEELMSELRLKGVFDPNDVYYAMLEPNGQISVLTKKDRTPLTPLDAKISVNESGMAQAVIVDGHMKEDSIKTLGMTEADQRKALKKHRAELDDVLLMTVDDSMSVNIIYKRKGK
jgi:uncharacterized membrane protein YcaP (DUF421 family)